MSPLNYTKTGLTVGLFLAAFHLAWALLVLSGVGQTLMDFILWAHMINIDYVVGPFDMTAAIMLLIVTFIIGYALGLAYAYIWNKLHRA